VNSPAFGVGESLHPDWSLLAFRTASVRSAQAGGSAMPVKPQKRIHGKDSWPGSGPSWSTARFQGGHKFMHDSRLKPGAWMCACGAPSILSALRHDQRRRFGTVIFAVNCIAPGRSPHGTPGYASPAAAGPDWTGDPSIGPGEVGIAQSTVVCMDGRTGAGVRPCIRHV
jgi:hypothetical protein